MEGVTCNPDPKSSMLTRRNAKGSRKRYASLIKEQYEQLVRQWLFLAKQAEAERFNRRTLIVRDPVLLCAHHS